MKIENNPILKELKDSVYKALENYSNVHRGSGHNSMVSTKLYEKAREIVLDYLNLNPKKIMVVFCSTFRAEFLKKFLKNNSFKTLTSKEIGLHIGVEAIAINKRNIPKGLPDFRGGGTARLTSTKWVLWSLYPDKFEAGTPAIVNVITFAKALILLKKHGNDTFRNIEQTLSLNEIFDQEYSTLSGDKLLQETKNQFIGKDISVPTSKGEKRFINLDNSASTPTFQPVFETYFNNLFSTGKQKEKTVEKVKSICADFVNAPLEKYEVNFTSNTTESINLVSKSLELENEGVIINSLLEHTSNDLPWRFLPKQSLIRIYVDSHGEFDLQELENLLKEYNQEEKHGIQRIKLVALSGASNVLGYCNNLKQISTIVHIYGAKLLIDAAQLVAHRKIDMEKEGIDYLAFSGHKIYAPFGCGVLVSRKGLMSFDSKEWVRINSLGEENIAGIAALGKSLATMSQIGMETIQKEEQEFTTMLLEEMAKIEGVGIHGVHSGKEESFKQKVGVVSFDVKGKMGDKVAKELAMFGGIGVRYGCHCAHIIVKHILSVGPGLEKFQKLILTLLPKVHLPGVTRVSLGLGNTKEDVEEFIEVLKLIASKKDNPIKATKAEVKEYVDRRVEDVYS
jgi:selenocysteine lyase/cysteine desulfurase